MLKLLANFRSRLSRLREFLFRSIFRARFRYDVFISYSHRDKEYAANLKRQLNSLDFTCFIDEEEAPPGSSLGPTIEKALSKSATLVLLASERALTRPYVALELEQFIPTKRPIIPISISGALTRNYGDALTKQPWDIIGSRKLIWIDETEDAFANNNPSPPIADGIDKLFKYTRRNVRVRAEIIATAMLVLLATIGAGYIIKGQASELSRQAVLVEAARHETEQQQGNAERARQEAQGQLVIAANAQVEAGRQERIARTAKEEAERQQEIARRATAEADRQQSIAKAARLEAEEQLRRSRQFRYALDVNFAHRLHETRDMTRVYDFLNPYLPTESTREQDDLRTFPWHYLWRNSYRMSANIKDAGYSVAFSPDGKTLATSPFLDNKVKILDVATGRELRALDVPVNYVGRLVFSPDGKTLATAGDDQTVKLWNTDTWEISATLRGHNDDIRSLAYSPKGDILASGTKYGPIKLWNTSTNQEITSINNGGLSLAFSPDGKTLATSISENTYVKLLDVATGYELKVLKGHRNDVNALVFSPDGKTLATAGDEPTVRLWNIDAPEKTVVIQAHRPSIFDVAFSPDGRIVATAAFDQTVKLWDAVTGEELAVLKHPEVVYSVAFSPDGKTLASGSADNTVKLWDVPRPEPEPLKLSDPVYSIAYSPDGKTLAAASSGHQELITFWDTSTGQETALKHARNNTSMAFSPDRRTFVFSSSHELAKLLDTGTKEEIGTIEDGGENFTFSPDGKMLAYSLGGTVKLWDTVKRRVLIELKGHTDSINSIAFSSDGKTLASGSADNRVKLWDVSRGQEIATLGGHTGNVLSLAFSPDGKTLASASRDNTVRLWDTAAKEELATLEGHLDSVNAVAFSPDGKTLASGGGDTTVKLWHVSTRIELVTLKGHTGGVASLAFSPDGNTLASASYDSTVRLWVVTTEDK